MKKRIAVIVSLALVLALVISLSACGGKNSVVGTWYFDSMEVGEMTVKVGDEGITKDYIKLEVNKDGTFKMTVQTMSSDGAGSEKTEYVSNEGTWKEQDGKYVFTMKDDAEAVFEGGDAVVKDGVLEIKAGEYKIMLKK